MDSANNQLLTISEDRQSLIPEVQHQQQQQQQRSHIRKAVSSGDVSSLSNNGQMQHNDNYDLMYLDEDDLLPLRQFSPAVNRNNSIDVRPAIDKIMANLTQMTIRRSSFEDRSQHAPLRPQTPAPNRPPIIIETTFDDRQAGGPLQMDFSALSEIETSESEAEEGEQEATERKLKAPHSNRFAVPAKVQHLAPPSVPPSQLVLKASNPDPELAQHICVSLDDAKRICALPAQRQAVYQTHIHDVCDDLLLHIFSELSVLDQLAAEQVCNRWHWLMSQLRRGRLAVKLLGSKHDNVRSHKCFSRSHQIRPNETIEFGHFQWMLNRLLPRFRLVHTLNLNLFGLQSNQCKELIYNIQTQFDQLIHLQIQVAPEFNLRLLLQQKFACANRLQHLILHGVRDFDRLKRLMNGDPTLELPEDNESVAAIAGLEFNETQLTLQDPENSHYCLLKQFTSLRHLQLHHRQLHLPNQFEILRNHDQLPVLTNLFVKQAHLGDLPLQALSVLFPSVQRLAARSGGPQELRLLTERWSNTLKELKLQSVRADQAAQLLKTLPKFERLRRAEMNICSAPSDFGSSLCNALASLLSKSPSLEVRLNGRKFTEQRMLSASAAMEFANTLSLIRVSTLYETKLLDLRRLPQPINSISHTQLLAHLATVCALNFCSSKALFVEQYPECFPECYDRPCALPFLSQDQPENAEEHAFDQRLREAERSERDQQMLQQLNESRKLHLRLQQDFIDQQWDDLARSEPASRRASAALLEANKSNLQGEMIVRDYRRRSSCLDNLKKSLSKKPKLIKSHSTTDQQHQPSSDQESLTESDGGGTDRSQPASLDVESNATNALDSQQNGQQQSSSLSPNASALRLLPINVTRLKWLNFCYTKANGELMLLELIRCSPYLRVFRLFGCELPTRLIPQLVQSCPLLCRLDLNPSRYVYSCKIGLARLAGLSNLVELILCNMRVHDRKLAHIMRSCPNLARVYLIACKGASGELIREFEQKAMCAPDIEFELHIDSLTDGDYRNFMLTPNFCTLMDQYAFSKVSFEPFGELFIFSPIADRYMLDVHRWPHPQITLGQLKLLCPELFFMSRTGTLSLRYFVRMRDTSGHSWLELLKDDEPIPARNHKLVLDINQRDILIK